MSVFFPQTDAIAIIYTYNIRIGPNPGNKLSKVNGIVNNIVSAATEMHKY